MTIFSNHHAVYRISFGPMRSDGGVHGRVPDDFDAAQAA
jgi:hypothetical protein